MGATDKVDKRFAATRVAAYEALVKLIPQKGLQGISVTDLCREAKINRGTFYNHWKSVPDLTNEIEDAFISNLYQRMADCPPIDREKMRVSICEDKTPPGVVQVFELFQEHKNFLRVVWGPGGDASFDLRVREAVSKIFLDLIVLGRFEYRDDTDAEYFAWYRASAFLGVVGFWILRDCPEPPEEIAMRFIRLMYHQPVNADSE